MAESQASLVANMAAAGRNGSVTKLEPVELPLWREVLFGVDWLALRVSAVYAGFGVPRGDGSAVIIVPGFLGADDYLAELHDWLGRIGYRPYYSGIGRNADCPEVLTERLLVTIDRAYAETRRRVRLIGHSLGGLIARSAAIRRPERVEQLISLAAPFRSIRAHPMVLAAASVVRSRILDGRRNGQAVRGECYSGSCPCEFARSLQCELPQSVLRAAIYTLSDGVVDWRSCLEDDARLNIEVGSTHAGLAFNPQVYRHLGRLLTSRY